MRLCDCLISPERQDKYVYYACTNYKKMHKERHYIREEALLKPIMDCLKNLKISKEVGEYIVKDIKKFNESKISYHTEALSALKIEYEKAQARIDGLINLLLDKHISKEDYDRKLIELKAQQQDLVQKMEDHRQADENYYVTVANVFDIASRAEEIFETSEVEEKTRILKFLLPNLRLRDKDLLIELRKPFDSLVDFNTLKDSYKKENAALGDVHPIWLGTVKDVRTWFVINI